MQQPMMPSTNVVVYGIPVADPETAKKVQRVMVCSAISAAMVVIYSLVGMVEIGSVTYLTNAAIGLLVPACGYFGAKNKNKSLVCAYWCCNLCQVIALAASAIVLLLAIAAVGAIAGQVDVQSLVQCCDTLGPDFSSSASPCISKSVSTHVYEPTSSVACGAAALAAGQSQSEAGVCYEYSLPAAGDVLLCCVDEPYCNSISQLTNFLGSAGKTMMEVTAGLAIVMMVPACVSCVLGYSLYNSPDHFVIQPTAYVGAPVMPVATQQQAYAAQQQAYVAKPAQF